jgi:hypothetical protein
MTDVQTRNTVDGWIQYALRPIVKRIEALEARLPKDGEKEEGASNIPASPHSREAEQ